MKIPRDLSGIELAKKYPFLDTGLLAEQEVISDLQQETTHYQP